MPPDEITDPRLKQRIARFKDLAFGEVACLDTLFPEHARKIAHVIGPAACEDPALRPAILEAENFHVAMIRADKGKGASLHSHPTVKVFMPFSGKWTIYWGDDGEHKTRLGLHDTISVPAGIMRGFTCESEGEHLLLAINANTPAPSNGRHRGWQMRNAEATRSMPRGSLRRSRSDAGAMLHAAV